MSLMPNRRRARELHVEREQLLADLECATTRAEADDIRAALHENSRAFFLTGVREDEEF